MPNTSTGTSPKNTLKLLGQTYLSSVRVHGSKSVFTPVLIHGLFLLTFDGLAVVIFINTILQITHKCKCERGCNSVSSLV